MAIKIKTNDLKALSDATGWTGGVPGTADTAKFDATYTQTGAMAAQTASLTFGSIWAQASSAMIYTGYTTARTLTLSGTPDTVNGAPNATIYVENNNYLSMNMNTTFAASKAHEIYVGSGGSFTNGNLGSYDTILTGTSVTLVKTGAGLWTFGGYPSNTFTGTVELRAGTIQGLSNVTQPFGNLANTIKLNPDPITPGGTDYDTVTYVMSPNGSSFTPKHTYRHNFVRGTTAVSVGTNVYYGLTGIVEGSGTLDKQGTGYLRIMNSTPANNTFTGNIKVTGAGIQLGSPDGTLRSANQLSQASSVTIAGGATYQIYHGTNDSFTTATKFSGTGSFMVAGTSTWTNTTGVNLTGDLSELGPETPGVWSGLVLFTNETPYTNRSIATIKNFPRCITFTHGTGGSGSTTMSQALYVASDAPGGTYPTKIFVSAGSTRTADPLPMKLVANQLNGAIVLTGGMDRSDTQTNAAAFTFTLDGGNAGNNTISGPVTSSQTAGTLALTKAGNGRWILAGNSSYNGGTTVAAGYLGARHSNALGTAATGAVTVASAATLEIGAGAEISKTAGVNINGQGVGAVGAIRCTDGDANRFVGAVTLQSDSYIGVEADAVLTLSAAPALGGKTLTKVGSGKLILAAPPSTTGAMVVNGGTVQLTYGSDATAQAVVVGSVGNLTMRDDGSHYRAVFPTGLTLQAGATLTFGPPRA